MQFISFLSQGNNTLVVRTGFEPVIKVSHLYGAHCPTVRLPISPPDYFVLGAGLEPAPFLILKYMLKDSVSLFIFASKIMCLAVAVWT